MATEMDRFYDLLATQTQTLTAQGQSLAKIEQAQVDLKERLFGNGAQPGAITYLATEHKELGNKHLLLAAELANVKTDRRVDKAYVMGATAVLTLAVKGLLSKLGWHF